VGRRYVLVDIDIPFSRFRRFRSVYREHVEWVLRHMRLGLAVRGMRALRSPSGNTHVLVHLDREVTEETALHLALCLGSDVAAFFEAMARLRQTGSSGYVPWSEKRAR